MSVKQYISSHIRVTSLTQVQTESYALIWGQQMKVPKQVRDYLSSLGKKGGPARRDKLTPKQRSEIARKAARARWAKRKGAGDGNLE